MICCKEMMIADEYEFADFYMTKEIDSKVSSKKKKKRLKGGLIIFPPKLRDDICILDFKLSSMHLGVTPNTLTYKKIGKSIISIKCIN